MDRFAQWWLLQVWSTWLFFAVLVDLGDAVAEELLVPFDSISLEMVFRGLYHFMQAKLGVKRRTSSNTSPPPKIVTWGSSNAYARNRRSEEARSN